jgi:4-amino-4-deoxy-L-arabinose transferase
MRRLIGTDKMLPAVACLLIAVGTVAYLLLPLQHHRMEAYREVVAKLNQLDPQRQLPTVAYETFLPSVSFYRQKLAIMVRGRTRETDFETDTAYKQWYFKSNEGLKEALSVYPRLFLLTAPRHVPEFSELTGFTCSEVFAGKKNNAYDCRR